VDSGNLVIRTGVRWWFLPCILALQACNLATVEGPAFQLSAAPTDDRANVYIYRPQYFVNDGSGLRPNGGPGVGYPTIYINGKKTFGLLRNGHILLSLAPGEYEIKAEGSFWTDWTWAPAVRKISVQRGGEYYIRILPALDVKNYPYTDMRLIRKERALREISQTNRIEE